MISKHLFANTKFDLKEVSTPVIPEPAPEPMITDPLTVELTAPWIQEAGIPEKGTRKSGSRKSVAAEKKSNSDTNNPKQTQLAAWKERYKARHKERVTGVYSESL